MIEKLIETLEKEKKLYEKELALARQRVEAIKTSNIESLQEIIKEEDQIIAKMKNLEKDRMNLLNNEENKSLKDFILHVKNLVLKDKLTELRTNLKSLLQDIAYQNEISKKLVNTSSDIINKILEKITNRQDVGYDKNKEKSKASGNNLVNTKI